MNKLNKYLSCVLCAGIIITGAKTIGVEAKTPVKKVQVAKKIKVKDMRFTVGYLSGLYNGEILSTTKKPDGIGTWKACDPKRGAGRYIHYRNITGTWKNGVCVQGKESSALDGRNIGYISEDECLLKNITVFNNNSKGESHGNYRNVTYKNGHLLSIEEGKYVNGKAEGYFTTTVYKEDGKTVSGICKTLYKNGVRYALQNEYDIIKLGMHKDELYDIFGVYAFKDMGDGTYRLGSEETGYITIAGTDVVYYKAQHGLTDGKDCMESLQGNGDSEEDESGE